MTGKQWNPHEEEREILRDQVEHLENDCVKYERELLFLRTSIEGLADTIDSSEMPKETRALLLRITQSILSAV